MDAAALSLKIDSSSVVTAANDLDRFAVAATKAEAAGKKIAVGGASGSIAKLVSEVQSANTKLTAIVGLLEKVANASRGTAAANDNLSRSYGAVDAHVVAYTQHLAGLSRAQQDANAHVLAYRANLAATTATGQQADAHVIAYRASLNQVEEGARRASTAIRFTATDGLNASRQLADIGVTAAMGMSPFLIAIQQGPQLLDILQNTAVRTGSTVGAVFRAAAVAVAAAAAPFLPLIALLTLAAAGIKALTAQANDDSGLKKYTTAMGYTKEEVKKLNAVTVTFGDTTKAVFQVGMESVASSLGISTSDMSKTWDRFLDRLLTGTRAVLAGVYALFAGTREYLGALERGGVVGLGKMLIGQGDPNLLANSYGKAYQDAQSGMDRIIDRARKNAQARQSAMAKGFYDKPTTPKGPKTDAEKLADIYAGAIADIATEKARGLAAELGASAEEATRLEKATSLLNAVQQKGIPITEAVRKRVGELADEYARAKTDADVSTALTASRDDIARQKLDVQEQAKLVGLYGDALARATREMEAQKKLRDSLPKGSVVVQYSLTSGLSDDIEANARKQRLADIAKASQDQAYALELERGALGLTGAALIAYNEAAAKKLEYQRAGIAMSPEELAAINAAAEAYGQQRYAIDRQAQALADTREVTRGFISDVIAGARNGADAFKTMADAAVNALNRIIDKLLDRALDAAMDGLFSSKSSGGGSGGFLGGLLKTTRTSGLTGESPPGAKADPYTRHALGGVFGTPTRFANGGAFTNSIVTSPTLFRFAKGSALGEMGEAGPEAIMPLKRGPNGALGVQMHGGGRGTVQMGDVHLHQSFAGAIGPDSIRAMNEQSAREAIAYIRQNFANIAAEYDTNGVVAAS